MTLKFIREWRNFKPSDRTDAIPDGVANILILRKIAERLVPTPPPVRKSKKVEYV